jgi:hypothetical protein
VGLLSDEIWWIGAVGATKNVSTGTSTVVFMFVDGAGHLMDEGPIDTPLVAINCILISYLKIWNLDSNRSPMGTTGLNECCYDSR